MNFVFTCTSTISNKLLLLIKTSVKSLKTYFSSDIFFLFFLGPSIAYRAVSSILLSLVLSGTVILILKLAFSKFKISVKIFKKQDHPRN